MRWLTMLILKAKARSQPNVITAKVGACFKSWKICRARNPHSTNSLLQPRLSFAGGWQIRRRNAVKPAGCPAGLRAWTDTRNDKTFSQTDRRKCDPVLRHCGGCAIWSAQKRFAADEERGRLDQKAGAAPGRSGAAGKNFARGHSRDCFSGETTCLPHGGRGDRG